MQSALGPFRVIGFQGLKIAGLAIGADSEAQAHGRLSALIGVQGDFAFGEFGLLHAGRQSEVEPRILSGTGWIVDSEADFDVGGRGEGLAILSARLESPALDCADSHFIEAESGASVDLNVTRRAVFVDYQTEKDGGVYA